jgi:hypothetical protein
MHAGLRHLLMSGAPPIADLRFDLNVLQLGGASYNTPSAIPGWTFARASEGRSLDGTLNFASGIPRIVPGLGILVEEARTNLFLNSSAPATQNVTITAAAHTITVWGSGSVTVAAGTATISNGGVVTAGSPRTIGCTGAGTISVTVTGSPTYVQVEAGSFGTSPIVTTGAAATRAADVPYVDGLSVLAPFSLVASGTLPTDTASGQKHLANLGQGADSNNRVILFRGVSNNAVVQGIIAGSGVLNVSSTFTGAGQLDAAMSHDGATFRGAIEGVATATVTSAGYGSTPLTRLSLGCGVTGATQLNGYLRRVQVYRRALTDAELQGASA